MAETFSSVYDSEPWVWKDPRTCLTFPLWRRVLGTEVRVVLVFRDPGAVVASLRRRDGIPSFYGAGLWQHYIRGSVAASAGLPALCLSFEDLVASPAQCIDTLVADLRSLGVDLSGDPGAAIMSMQSQLVHGEPTSALVGRLTRSTADVIRSLPRRSAQFEPPSWREPRWVHPLLVAYRGPWAIRARAGHPLRPGFA